MVPRLAERYQKEIVPRLQKEFGYKNVMEVPRIVKVVVNAGVGDAKQDYKMMDAAVSEVETITGQHPMVKSCLLYTSPSPRDS